MAESSETSPLLAEDDRPDHDDREVVDTPTYENPFLATSYFRFPVKIITVLLLVFSILALAVLVASYITIQHAPFKQWYWNATENIKPTGVWVGYPISYRFDTG